MSLHIEFSRRALKTLTKSDSQTRKRILEKIKELREKTPSQEDAEESKAKHTYTD